MNEIEPKYKKEMQELEKKHKIKNNKLWKGKKLKFDNGNIMKLTEFIESD